VRIAFSKGELKGIDSSAADRDPHPDQPWILPTEVAVTNQATRTIINSWNEWDPLKHVIVGQVDRSSTIPPERENPDGFPNWGAIFHTMDAEGQGSFEKAHEEMETFAGMLQARGIRVDRPTSLDFSQSCQTPDWEHPTMFGCMPPRDLLICFGNEILEATMSFRDRWFEYLCYRPLLEQYFKEDPNFLWEAAPKPRLTEETYVQGYWHNFQNVWSEAEKIKRAKAHQWWLTDKEPLFDAADMMRVGVDIFVQPSVITNAPGIDWLRRHLEPRGFRLHEVDFGEEDLAIHIDCQFIIPRPGLLLQSPNLFSRTPEFHELFKKNGWEVVVAAPSRGQKPDPSYFLAYNVLSLDPQTICVEASEEQVIEQLGALGLDVIPVEFRDVAVFGGGLHCGTLDIYREGDCEDYLPEQIEGF
jgi:glycine amidinotransferase